MSGWIIGIDASRNRSGGGKTHIIELLRALNPYEYGISKIVVWSYKNLLDSLPDYPWLIKHYQKELDKILAIQLYWQKYRLPKIARTMGCHILLNTDAGTLCRFRPAVTISRDMIPFDRMVQKKYPLGYSLLRIIILRYVSARSLRFSDGVIFLTRHAAETIIANIGPITNYRIIPHGVSETFKNIAINSSPKSTNLISCLYISSIEYYKNHMEVIRAIKCLREQSINVELVLVGEGKGKFMKKLNNFIREIDPNGEFIKLIGAVKHDQIPKYISKADIFIFASSCENMPNILLEGMAAGIPIACSNINPMPEILKDSGEYFNPNDYESIMRAIKVLAFKREYARALARKAKCISMEYSWERCAKETFSYLIDILNSKGGKNG